MKLTIVGLPLGNIEDISLRAINKLSEAQVVICEDTRVFSKLWMKLAMMGHLKGNFEGKLVVLNEFNEKDKAVELAKKVVEYGDEVILVSDAGMPLISDPGYRLVQALVELNVEITIIPGPTAVMTALAASGLPTDRLFFLGFLPKKQAKRDEIWEQLKNVLGTTVAIYEAPGRVIETLQEISRVFGGNTNVVIARELTKKHEEFKRGRLNEILRIGLLEKGEFVVLFRV